MAKRCLFICDPFLPTVGGAPVVYDQIARQLPYQIDVLAPYEESHTHNPIPGVETFDAKVPYKVIRRARLRPLASGRTGFFTRLRQWFDHRQFEAYLTDEVTELARDYDVVIIGGIATQCWLVGALKRRLKKPVIAYVHGEEISDRSTSFYQRYRTKVALKKLSYCIVVSDNTRRLVVEQGVKPDAVMVLSNGVSPLVQHTATREDIRTNLGLKAGDLLVLSVGRLVERKGFDTLMQAWPLILEAYPQARWALAGAGPLAEKLKKDSKDLAKKYNLTTVQLLGEVSRERLSELYTAADVFVMPNRTLASGDAEGFGLVFLEAGLSGVPVVGGRSGGVPEAIIDGQTGLLVDGRNYHDVAQAVIRLLLDKKLRRQMGRTGHEYAKSQSWDVKAAKLAELIDALG